MEEKRNTTSSFSHFTSCTEWKEDDHPRNEGGEFTSGGGEMSKGSDFPTKNKKEYDTYKNYKKLNEREFNDDVT